MDSLTEAMRGKKTALMSLWLAAMISVPDNKRNRTGFSFAYPHT